MTVSLRLGYLPLVDAAPLILAQTLGFAEEEGLQFDLQAAPSWAQLRDMLTLGQVAAAHILSPVPVALALGLARGPAQLEALSVLNLNGNVIGVSNALAQKMQAAGYAFDFKDASAAGRALLVAQQRLVIGVPFAFSMHVELVQYWLSALGADPARLEIRTVPPPRMAEALAAGEIDAFCVGEPWGSIAVESRAGSLLLPGRAIWAGAPEKVLATRAGWAEAEPGLAGGLLRAVWRAGRWLGLPENHGVASEILASPRWLSVAPEVIERAFSGRMVIGPDGTERQTPGFAAFHDGAASFPWRSQAAWIGVQMATRAGIDVHHAAKAAAATFRSDLYRLHLRDLGADLPGASEKLEGALAQPSAVAAERGTLILSEDRFFDARIFDPSLPGR